MSPRVVRVVVVDDSSMMRTLYRRTLGGAAGIEVVGDAPDPYVARDVIVEKSPDVLVLDMEMPRMDGLTFLRLLMRKRPIGVVVCSSLTEAGSDIALEALSAGAAAVICKPRTLEERSIFDAELVQAVRAAAGVRHDRAPVVSAPRQVMGAAVPANALVAIGASTGGTVALEKIIEQLPANVPPIVVAQHMPEYMTAPFAARLKRMSVLEAHEAADGERLVPGTLLVAPGGRHLRVERDGAMYRARLDDRDRVSGHRPSVDVLFESVASAAGPHAIAALLTGMGRDGAEGLHSLRDQGARTFVQDEASCVVYGMPKAALDVDARHTTVALASMAGRIVQACSARA